MTAQMQLKITDYRQAPLRFKIDEVLQKRGMSRWKLAEALGTNLKHISKYCDNKVTRVDMGTIQRTAEILGVTYSDLIEIN